MLLHACQYSVWYAFLSHEAPLSFDIYLLSRASVIAREVQLLRIEETRFEYEDKQMISQASETINLEKVGSTPLKNLIARKVFGQ